LLYYCGNSCRDGSTALSALALSWRADRQLMWQLRRQSRHREIVYSTAPAHHV
jgi:hypothetical protein